MEQFVITIARGYGSGGKTLGNALAQQLEVPCYGREVVRMASEDSGIHQRLFTDEALRRGLFRPDSKVYRGELIPPESDEFVSDENLFNFQAKVMKDLAQKESCVIIGRCADFVLQGRPNLLRVFVYAPEEDCIKTVTERFALSEKEARKKIHSIDKHRGAFYKYYTGHEWNDARNYDLSLNSAALGQEGCIAMIKKQLELMIK